MKTLQDRIDHANLSNNNTKVSKICHTGPKASEERVQLEEIKYINWINSLDISDVNLDSLSLDQFNDGIQLLKIFEAITNSDREKGEGNLVKWSKVEMKSNNKFKKQSNCNYFLKLIVDYGFQVTNINGRDIVGSDNITAVKVGQDDKMYIFSILWLLMKENFIQKNGVTSDYEVNLWANQFIYGNDGKEEECIANDEPDYEPPSLVQYMSGESEVFMNFTDDSQQECPFVPKDFDILNLNSEINTKNNENVIQQIKQSFKNQEILFESFQNFRRNNNPLENNIGKTRISQKKENLCFKVDKTAPETSPIETFTYESYKEILSEKNKIEMLKKTSKLTHNLDYDKPERINKISCPIAQKPEQFSCEIISQEKQLNFQINYKKIIKSQQKKNNDNSSKNYQNSQNPHELQIECLKDKNVVIFNLKKFERNNTFITQINVKSIQILQKNQTLFPKIQQNPKKSLHKIQSKKKLPSKKENCDPKSTILRKAFYSNKRTRKNTIESGIENEEPVSPSNSLSLSKQSFLYESEKKFDSLQYSQEKPRSILKNEISPKIHEILQPKILTNNFKKHYSSQQININPKNIENNSIKISDFDDTSFDFPDEIRQRTPVPIATPLKQDDSLYFSINLNSITKNYYEQENCSEFTTKNVILQEFNKKSFSKNNLQNSYLKYVDDLNLPDTNALDDKIQSDFGSKINADLGKFLTDHKPKNLKQKYTSGLDYFLDTYIYEISNKFMNSLIQYHKFDLPLNAKSKFLTLKIFKAFNRKFKRRDLYENPNLFMRSDNKENLNRNNKILSRKNDVGSGAKGHNKIIHTLYVIERMKKLAKILEKDFDSFVEINKILNWKNCSVETQVENIQVCVQNLDEFYQSAKSFRLKLLIKSFVKLFQEISTKNSNKPPQPPLTFLNNNSKTSKKTPTHNKTQFLQTETKNLDCLPKEIDTRDINLMYFYYKIIDKRMELSDCPNKLPTKIGKIYIHFLKESEKLKKRVDMNWIQNYLDNKF